MMTNSNDEGVDKVLANRGGYVYIMESGSLDYQVGEQYEIDIISICLNFRLLGTAV